MCYNNYNMHILRQYPRLFLLACSFIAAYLLLHFGYFDIIEHKLNGHGYISVFLAGLLFSFGFTSPFGIAFFIEVAPHVHPLLAAPIGGFAAFLMDLCIFELMRFSTFHDELHRLRTTALFERLHTLLHHENISERVRLYLLWSMAGLVIASPLRDEIGVTLVSGITNVDTRKFGLLCFAMNTLGILVILLIAH